MTVKELKEKENDKYRETYTIQTIINQKKPKL